MRNQGSASVNHEVWLKFSQKKQGARCEKCGKLDVRNNQWQEGYYRQNLSGPSLGVSHARRSAQGFFPISFHIILNSND